MNIILLSLVVFAITLTITKADIWATKREFVKNRYEASFVGGEKPNWVHTWWYKMNTCPMCSGFWVSLVVSIFWAVPYGYVATVLALYGLNWLWHCLEHLLFYSARYYEKL